MISHPEPPEFHTQPSTPISPLPLHPPEPSKIPVLQHQIDPIFNMTTTHEPLIEAPAAESKVTDSGDSSPSHDSSFSDAYKENPEEEKKDDVVTAAPQESGAEVDDDYGMTLDSEDEEQSDYHDVSESHVEQDTASLPVTVPAAAIPSPPISHNSKTSETPHNGPDNKPTQSKFSPPHATPTPASATPSVNHAAQLPVQTLQSQPHKYEDISNGGIDIQQLLDNITANAENNAAASGLAPTTPSVVSSLASLPFGSSNPPNLPSHASLPPRPQVSSYRPASLVAAGAPGTSSDPRNGLPPPPTASFHTPPQPMPTHTQQGAYQTHSTAALVSSTLNDDADKKWTPKTQKIYDDFLEQERQYVAEGLWDRFPLGSRLFIGNLSSENVTKRDIFHVFHRYGRLAQVSIKQAYGFVQFHDSPACKAALETEQGREIRGKKIHLEISKPQKNTRNAQKATPQQQVRRSRSPEHQRGGMSERGGRSNQSGGRNGDHYDNRSGQSGRDEYGRTMRPRDDYRSGRSPSPPRGNYRGRDDFGSNRGRDYYDGRRRSRSNSPYSQRDNGRYRERSLSPGARQAAEDADLQIPRRNPRDVPDVQIILLDELDRGFVSWVDGQFRDRGLKSEIMFLSPRLPVQAVIRRQILEGVHAVCKLDIRSQNSSKIPLQVFDRQAGANNVRFDEYEDLEPRLAAELVLRTKAQSQTPIYTQPQPQPQYPSGQSYQPYHPQVAPAPAPAPVPAQDLASLVGQLDNATLQRLLSALPPQQQNAPAVAANSAIDLAGLLGGLQTHLPPATPQPTYHQQTAPASAPAPYNPGPASFQPQQQPQSAQQVQNIMAQLAKFRQ